MIFLRGKREKKEKPKDGTGGKKSLLKFPKLDALRGIKSSPNMNKYDGKDEKGDLQTPTEVELRKNDRRLSTLHQKPYSSYPLMDVYQAEKAIIKEEKHPPRPRTPEGTTKIKSVPLDPSRWEYHCARVWSKALKDLPVAIDFPRLAPSTSIVHKNEIIHNNKNEEHVQVIEDYTPPPNAELTPGEEAISFKKDDILVVLENTMDNWLKIQFNGKIGIVPLSCVKYLPHIPVRKEKRTLEIIVELATLLEGQPKAEKIEREYYKYIPGNLDPTDARDISRELNRFLKEVVEEDSPTVRILKACNQAIIAPAVIELTLNIQKKISFKDGGGWRIRIAVVEDRVIVTHWKRQKHVAKHGEVELFEFFEWELSLEFDARVEKIINFRFSLSEIHFKNLATIDQRNEIISILNSYFSEQSGRRRNSKEETI